MLQLLRVFLLGFRESRGDIGMTYDDDPTSTKSRAYDLGRNLGKKMRN